MNKWFMIVVLLLSFSVPLYGQSEGDLRAFFEGKTVVVKIDMPGTSEGVDIRPEKKPEMDYKVYLARLRKYEVAVKKGDSILLTQVKVKGDLIEVHLGAGGFTSRLNYTRYQHRFEKSGREVSSEAESERAQYPARRPGVQDQRQQEEIDRNIEELQRRRREGGSRFNLRYSKKIPPEALTPESVMQVLANYVEFPSQTFAVTTKPPSTKQMDTAKNVSGDSPPAVETRPPISEPRVALVIGNSAYKDGMLPNPVNDARDIARTLNGLGFEVIQTENQTQTEMKRAIRVFGEKLRGGGVGLFYYAGHGVQVSGQNYMIPVGAVIDKEEEVEYEGVNVGLVLAQMEDARNRINIIILDACRNNPFASSFRSSPPRGLAVIKAPTGTLIEYATAPGNVASDGGERNGLYTQELLRKMQAPGLSVEEVFKSVRAAVVSKTQGKQIPWESSSLTGSFYFKSLPVDRK